MVKLVKLALIYKLPFSFYFIEISNPPPLLISTPPPPYPTYCILPNVPTSALALLFWTCAFINYKLLIMIGLLIRDLELKKFSIISSFYCISFEFSLGEHTFLTFNFTIHHVKHQKGDTFIIFLNIQLLCKFDGRNT